MTEHVTLLISGMQRCQGTLETIFFEHRFQPSRSTGCLVVRVLRPAAWKGSAWQVDMESMSESDAMLGASAPRRCSRTFIFNAFLVNHRVFRVSGGCVRRRKYYYCSLFSGMVEGVTLSGAFLRSVLERRVLDSLASPVFGFRGVKASDLGFRIPDYQVGLALSSKRTVCEEKALPFRVCQDFPTKPAGVYLQVVEIVCLIHVHQKNGS